MPEADEQLGIAAGVANVDDQPPVGLQHPSPFGHGGREVDTADSDRLQLGDGELSDYRFATPNEAATLLRPDINDRLQRALAALTTGATAYVEHQRRW
jgi:hypothetical protein